MKEYKPKFTTMMFETGLGLCATWFIYNLVGKFTHSFLFAVIGTIVVFVFFFYKIFYVDFISITLTEDRKMLVKRFNKVIKSFEIDNYYWSEYSKYSKTKNAEDQDIYYVSKENGKEDSIDLSNFKGEDYEQLLMDLGAKVDNDPAIKVATIKK